MSPSHATIVGTKIPPGKPTDLRCGNKNTTIDKRSESRLLEGGAVDLRELKALEIAVRSKIAFDGQVWVVPSQSAPSNKYRVTLAPPACQCEDFQLRAQPCKHVI